MADALVNGKAIELRFLVSQKLCKHYNIFQISILHIVPKIFSKLILRNSFESILPLIMIVCVYSNLNDDVKIDILNALSKIY